MTPVEEATQADRYFDRLSETLSREALQRLQQERLVESLAYAYERSGLVRSLWETAGVRPEEVREPEDFKALVPFTSKATSLAYRAGSGDPFGGMCCVDPAELTFAGVSSGTTGSIVFFPERTLYSLDGTGGAPLPCAPFSSTQQATWDRNLWELGLRPGDYMMFSSYTYRGPNFQPCQALGATPIFTDHYPADFRRMVRLAQELRPTVLYLISGPMMIELEEMAGDVDLGDVFSSFRGVAWGGEALSSRKRQLLEEWGVRPFQVANVGDASGSIECRERAGAHVWEDTVLIEVLDRRGNEVSDGEVGELVVTSLTNRVSPQIRWRSDDLVRIDRRPCGCGRTHARIAIMGRRGDIAVVAGRTVVPADIMPIVEALPATEDGLFQIIRTGNEMDSLRLRVGYRPEAGQLAHAIKTELHDRIDAALGIDSDLELVEEAVLLQQGPPHKIPRVVGQ